MSAHVFALKSFPRPRPAAAPAAVVESKTAKCREASAVAMAISREASAVAGKWKPDKNVLWFGSPESMLAAN